MSCDRPPSLPVSEWHPLGPSTLLQKGWVILHCMHVPLFFIYPPVEGHLSYFPVLAVVNRAAVNVGMHGCFCIMFFFFFSRYTPRSGISGSYGSSIFRKIDRKPRNKLMHLWTINLWQKRQDYRVLERLYLQQMVLGKLDSYMEKKWNSIIL